MDKIKFGGTLATLSSNKAKNCESTDKVYAEACSKMARVDGGEDHLHRLHLIAEMRRCNSNSSVNY